MVKFLNMLKTICILILFTSNLCFSQNDSFPELLIHYSNDRSIVLIAYNQSKLNSDSINMSDPKISLDTLIKYFKIELDLIPDTNYLNTIKYNLYLDSLSFSQLIIKSDLKMIVWKYGFAGSKNYEDLSLKYGVKFYAGGCINDPSLIEKEYSNFMRKLLVIRNGSDWEEKYFEEARKRN